MESQPKTTLVPLKPCWLLPMLVSPTLLLVVCLFVLLDLLVLFLPLLLPCLKSPKLLMYHSCHSMLGFLFGWLDTASLAAFFDLTRYVRLATRFLDEIFALLIVSIFVLDAVGDPFSSTGLLRYLDPNHKVHQNLWWSDADYNYLVTAFLSPSSLDLVQLG